MTKTNVFHCDYCGRNLAYKSDFTTGYGQDSDGLKSCYACCAAQDVEFMREHGHITLYLSWDNEGVYRGANGHGYPYKNARVTNWPSSLVFNNGGRGLTVSRGHHNIAGVRYDTWFVGPDGFLWWGVSYGHYTQLVHCKRTKEHV